MERGGRPAARSDRPSHRRRRRPGHGPVRRQARPAGDGAVMVDLSGWHRLNVDPSARTVTARPGVTWAELDQATARFGLATTGADVPAVGVAGTALGGGFGWLHRLHGLSCDTWSPGAWSLPPVRLRQTTRAATLTGCGD